MLKLHRILTKQEFKFLVTESPDSSHGDGQIVTAGAHLHQSRETRLQRWLGG